LRQSHFNNSGQEKRSVAIWRMRCWLAMAFVAACDGTSGGPDAGTDGGFGDAALVVVPPTHIVDESRDVGLLLTMRPLPNDDPM
jgi:hypothetical protein